MNMHKSVFKDQITTSAVDRPVKQRRVRRLAAIRHVSAVTLLTILVFVAGMAVTNWDALIRTLPVYYGDCATARAAGAAQISRGSPGYGPHLDEDRDGVACEPFVDD